jgi:hypothetical protein
MAEIPHELAEALGDVRVPPVLIHPVITMWQSFSDEDQMAFLGLLRRIPDPLARVTFVSISAPLFLLSGVKPVASGGPVVTVDDPVMLVRINKLYRPGISSHDLYEVTRRAWKVGTRRAAPKFACAVFQGVVCEVYEIGHWRKASPRTGDAWKGSRWEFVGKIADESVRSKYLGRSVKSYFTRGARNPIKYVNC